MQDLKITLIQSELFWEERARNLSMFSEKISSIEEETDLILLPEMFSTGFTMHASQMAEEMNGHTIMWMEKEAKKKNCVIAGSMIIKDNGRFYNRLIWMRPDGLDFYDKRHLFTYAQEDVTYREGNSKILVTLKGWKILPLICYDLRFPVWSRRNKDYDYDLLIYVANWPERRVYAWKQLLIARAIENQCYVAGLNRIGNDGNNIFHSGESAVIDFKGEVLSKIPVSENFTGTFTLPKDPLESFREQFAFYNDRDEFEIYP